MQATLLKNYYKYFTETFGYTKHSEESKFAAELASTAIYNITQQLGAMISYNLTLQALQKYIQLNGAPNCVTQLENPTSTPKNMLLTLSY